MAPPDHQSDHISPVSLPRVQQESENLGLSLPPTAQVWSWEQNKAGAPGICAWHQIVSQGCLLVVMVVVRGLEMGAGKQSVWTNLAAAAA